MGSDFISKKEKWEGKKGGEGREGGDGGLGEPRLKFNNSSPSCVLRALSHH